MDLLLHIETSYTSCSVAISNGNQLIDEIEGTQNNDHAAQLAVLIKNILQKNQFKIADLKAVCVSSGPGSYTGLRIGAATAKGICHALNLPLISVNTLQAMAAGAASFIKKRNALYCPLIDARRMEVYFGIYNYLNQIIKKPSPIIIDDHSFLNLLQQYTIYFFGSGLNKCKDFLQHTNSIFIENINPTASYLITSAYKNYTSKNFDDIITFQPEYLKEFYATFKK